MDDQLRTRLEDVVRRLDSSFHAQGRADIDGLYQAGVQTYTDLLRLPLDTNASADTRAMALWALSRLGDERGLAAMLVVLDDPAPAVRAAAAQSIGELDGPLAKTATNALMSRLGDADETVRRAAVNALGMTGDPRSLQPLIDSLTNQQETATVRGVAAEALANLRDSRATPALLEALTDDVSEVRYWAAFALGEVAGPDALVRLNSVALTDSGTASEGKSVRDEAAAAIDRIEERALLNVLGIVHDDTLRVLSPSTLSQRLRLTDISARLAQSPTTSELDLTEHEGRAIIVRGYIHDGWLYRTTILEVASPVLSALVQDVRSSGEHKTNDVDEPEA